MPVDKDPGITPTVDGTSSRGWWWCVTVCWFPSHGAQLVTRWQEHSPPFYAAQDTSSSLQHPCEDCESMRTVKLWRDMAGHWSHLQAQLTETEVGLGQQVDIFTIPDKPLRNSWASVHIMQRIHHSLLRWARAGSFHTQGCVISWWAHERCLTLLGLENCTLKAQWTLGG